MANPNSAMRAAALACAMTLAAAAPSAAGGYDTGARDWDFLFQPDSVAFEAGVRYIVPRRSLDGIIGVFGPSPDVDETEAFALPHASLAVRFGDAARCMASYREPYAGHANYGTAWTYAFSATEQHFSSVDFGLTCAGSVALGKGRLHIIGGLSYQEIDYELVQLAPPPAPAGTIARTNVSDGGLAWRAGLAYDIPEYALRASLIYNSAVDYNMTGTHSLFGPVFGSITMPQSLELKAQTGVAPGWLVFGSVRWTDWSVVYNMPIISPVAPVPGGVVSGLTLMWKDTWTVTVGAAHQFSYKVSAAASLTWDQGATQGFTSQTDTWTAGLTAIVTPGENVELQFGGTLGILTGGTLSTMVLPGGIPNPVGYTATFGSDAVYSLNASATIRF